MSRNSVGYVVGFAAAVCVVCGVLVAGSAVALKDRQVANATADRQKKVLTVAGILEEGASVSNEEAQSLFESKIQSRVVDMKTGEYADEAVDPAIYDARKAAKDPEASFEMAENTAKVTRMPEYTVIYQVVSESGTIEQVILPVQGPGLWSTLYGYLSVEPDGNTIRGITFYEHGETPGLGGEVDNPKWKSLWPGRKIFDDSGEIAIKVVKGQAGPVEEAPHKVDGLSGATLTSNGVTYTLQFWMGPDAFGPYLDNLRG